MNLKRRYTPALMRQARTLSGSAGNQLPDFIDGRKNAHSGAPKGQNEIARGTCPGLDTQNCFEPCRGEIAARPHYALIPFQERHFVRFGTAAGVGFRPFRAWKNGGINPWDVALGHPILSRWGSLTREHNIFDHQLFPV